ncbi:MAG: glycosyl transferase [Candidatus Sumerlaeia bacterium]|nr:glycosyl transferase [Candidatus Sumerlaeia bacterium]
MNMKTFARRLGAGRALYHVYHAPIGWVRRIVRDTPWRRFVAWRGRAAMRAAAGNLPSINWSMEELEGAPEVNFLTGTKFWDQTMFCAWTLFAHAGRPLRLVLWDDGTLNRDTCEIFHRTFSSSCRVVKRSDVEAQLQAFIDSRPTLLQRRLVYPHLRKVTDIHALDQGWKLVLDSDMLFFQRPDAILNWLDDPQEPLLMKDVQTSYGRSLEALQAICGKPLQEQLNVGVCGLNSRDIIWEDLEKWHSELIADGKASYYDEQALVAMMASSSRPEVLDGNAYICLPSGEEISTPRGVLHHYVAGAKLEYFTTAWRKALQMGLEAIK